MLAEMAVSRAVLGFIALAGCSGGPAVAPIPPRAQKPPAAALPSSSAPQGEQSEAPVVVLIVVDQLASWVFEQRKSSFTKGGGFEQLLREGKYGTLRYEHATTSTAPGHAALFTGLPPRGSGVFANERLDDAGTPTSMFADPSTKAIGSGPFEGTGASTAVLRAQTLADALRTQRPDAHIIAVSLKDRASVPGGGKASTLSVWFDAERESFVTSSAFANALPSWLGAHQEKLKRELGGTWQPLDEAWLEQHAPTADAQAGEGDFGPAVHFPYDLKQAKHRGKAFRGYPAADRAVLSLSRAALDALPSDARHTKPLLLVLSMSALDYVGHVHGPDSWESWEVLRELDRELGRFFDELSQRFGERVSIVLSADHGTAPLPETAGDRRARPWCAQPTPDPFERPCTKGERLKRVELTERLEKAARDALGPGRWLRGVVEPFAYFSPEALRLPSASRSKLEQACIKALEKHPGVARVFSSRELSAVCPIEGESLPALVCRSLPPGAGDLYIVSEPGSFFDTNLVAGHGINHGSPYLYDRTVPVLVRSPRATAGKTITEVIRPADVTATAAALLHIAPPPGAANGRNLAAE
ncbi:MAG: Alkaline phosphatase [Polyangiaceae bacterium]|nr:Alkaline phosphatase [Polyangiaceae bacterium]